MLLLVSADSECAGGAGEWVYVLCDHGRAAARLAGAVVRGDAVYSSSRPANAVPDGDLAGSGESRAGHFGEVLEREVRDSGKPRSLAALGMTNKQTGLFAD